MKNQLKDTKKASVKPTQSATAVPGTEPELQRHAENDELRALNKPGTELMIRRMSDLVPLEAELRERQKIIEFHSDQQDVVQAFRSLRTLLLQQAGPKNFSVLVTSVQPGDGASFVARNLAAALAFDQTRTALLMDCNRSDPTLNGLLVAQDSQGLTDLLDNPQAVSVADIIYSTGIPRLRVIPVGSQRDSPVEYFTTQRMRAFLSVLSRRYSDRYIVVDSPAIQSNADARILADWCDYIVVVARYGETTKPDLMNAIATLPQEKFAGVVFNDFDPVAAEPNRRQLQLSKQ